MRLGLATAQAFSRCTLLVATVAAAAPQDVAPPTVEELKRAYLTSDREAARRVLRAGEAALSPQVSEELMRRGFEGDFGRLLDWWRAKSLRRKQLARQRNDRASR